MSEKVAAISPRNVKLLPCVVYGSAFAMLVFYSIRSGWISHPILDRYVMGHPVSNVETIMLCVGLLALAMKTVGLWQEQQMLAKWEDPRTEELPFLEEDWAEHLSKSNTTDSSPKKPDSSVDEAEMSDDYLQSAKLLRVLELRQNLKRPQSAAGSTLTQRMVSVLNFIHSRRSAEGVADHLKHLAGQDADAQHDSYSLIRLMVWAIPMLGFLGTVIGISEALGGLDLGDGADLSVLISNLKSSLYVAFDTTALALTYGVILMFFQFGLDRTESSFMQKVDRKAEDFILKSFATTEEERDPVAKSIQRMGQALLKATFSLVEHQHDLWNESLTAAQDAWVSATENSQNQANHVLHEVVDGASDRMVEKLTAAMNMADEQLQHRWQQWQVTLSDNARSLSGFQSNATSHIEMLQQFFQTASNLSEEQQQSIQQLVGRLDDLVNQSKSLQEYQIAEQKHREEQLEAKRIRELQVEQEKKRIAEQQREGIRWIVENHPEFIGPISPTVHAEQRRRLEQERLVQERLVQKRLELDKVELEAEIESPVPAAPLPSSFSETTQPHGASQQANANEKEDEAAIDSTESANETVEEHEVEEHVVKFEVQEEPELADCEPEPSAEPVVTKISEPVSVREFAVRPVADAQWSVWDPFEVSTSASVTAGSQGLEASTDSAEEKLLADAGAAKDETPREQEIEADVDTGGDTLEISSTGADVTYTEHSLGDEENLYVAHFAESSQPPKRHTDIAAEELAAIERQWLETSDAKVVARPISSLKIHGDDDATSLPQVSLVPVASSESKAEEVEQPRVNSNIRSMLVPFSDAKVQRAS